MEGSIRAAPEWLDRTARMAAMLEEAEGRPVVD